MFFFDSFPCIGHIGMRGVGFLLSTGHSIRGWTTLELSLLGGGLGVEGFRALVLLVWRVCWLCHCLICLCVLSFF